MGNICLVARQRECRCKSTASLHTPVFQPAIDIQRKMFLRDKQKHLNPNMSIIILTCILSKQRSWLFFFTEVYKDAEKLIAVLCNRNAAKWSKEKMYFVWTLAYRNGKNQSF